jgi:hypothetical protein
MAVQSGEEADDEPPAALVGTSDDPVDGAVFASDRIVGLSTAVGAGTEVERPRNSLISLGHGPYLPDRDNGAVSPLYSKC